MAKKKIVFIITKSNWGGAQKYVYELATSLSAENFDCLVILGGEGELKQKLETQGVRVISLSGLERDISIGKEFKVLRELVTIFNKEKPDVIHLNSSKIGGLGSLAGRVSRVENIIFTAHGWAFKEPRGVLSKAFIMILSWLTIIFSHKVITLSNVEKNFVAGWPFCFGKVSVVPIGIRDLKFMSKEEARQKLSLEKRSSLIAGNIAELHKNKGLTYAVDAFSRLKEKNVVYEIIGEGEERSDLEKRIANLQLREKIKLIGKVSDAGLYLKAFDMFLFPSVKEGLPYSLLEAGLASLPVIATNVGGIPEVIDNMKNGLLVAPKDPEAIQKALEFYLSHPEKAREFGQALREKVLTRFSLENMVEKTIKLYQD